MNAMLQRVRRAAKRASDSLFGAVAVGLIKIVRLTNPDRIANVSGWIMRRLGPLFPENKVGRDNLTHAFPEKSAAEIEIILGGVWENLGRMGAEFAHLDRLWDFDPNRPGRIEIPQSTIDRFIQIQNDGKPALIFAAHLGNWELPAICGATYELDSAVLYRKPNIPAVDRWLNQTRAASMGELIATDLSAPVKIAEALQRGAHVGMLVDQYYRRGVPVIFFGQRTMANPLLARLAQHFDCPIYGAHMIRLPGNRFRGEMTEEIAAVRGSDGKVDIAATMQVITTVIEGWVREHPEQWLWLHRRWRPNDEIIKGP
ncbi:MAG: lipid A biosynthesis lauroyl acyltransferase [Pseudolabrys sp.]